MLANQGDLFQLWQLPFIILFLVGWIFGGGYLFHKTLSKLPSQKKMKIGKGILVSTLSVMVGGMAAAAIFVVFYKNMDLPIVGMIVGLPFFILMTYLVVFTMFKDSAVDLAKACVLPLVGIIVFGGVLGAACGIPTLMNRRAYIEQIKFQNLSFANLSHLYDSISNKPANPPKSIEDILKIEGVDPAWSKSPANPSREIGFFYFQPERLGLTFEERTQKIQRLLACDYKDNFADYPEPGRAILLTTGDTGFMPEASFQSLLDKPENQAFAEALRKAEGQ